MTISIENNINGFINTLPLAVYENGMEKNLFEEHLKQQLAANANSTHFSNSRKEEKKGQYDDDIESIKSEGLHAYMRDLQEKQMEELREEILEEMGLTEEALHKMPAEQQIKIEKMISEKIQQRLSLMSAMKMDDEKVNDSSPAGQTRSLLKRSDIADPLHDKLTVIMTHGKIRTRDKLR